MKGLAKQREDYQSQFGDRIPDLNAICHKCGLRFGLHYGGECPCRHPEGRKLGSRWCEDCNLATCINFHDTYKCGQCEYIGKCMNDPQKADYCPNSW